MNTRMKFLLPGIILSALVFTGARAQTTQYNEPYRPQLHFSPAAKWMNDPNGMVYFQGTYHLFYQHFPGGTTWGPMHWGHATSKDLVHWQQKPIALYPDSLGYIFSGSAVADINNTSGFGQKGQVPLVAIFTHHDPKGEKEGKENFQNQSIAYSLDNGNTWTKYAGNPVVKNPGIRDFRDPKVMWFAAGKKWIMTLATKDRITFYSSPDLKNWKKESEFGEQRGAHGGVWECPDLFPLELNGKTYWVLLVSINPGGPNKGSATQYFVGQFDGHSFKSDQQQTRWIDYGPDNYAGITWSNTGSRKIFLGWMSNWIYANEVPTDKWRNAATIPRDLRLANIKGEILLTSHPSPELSKLAAKPVTIAAAGLASTGTLNVTNHLKLPGQYKLEFKMDKIDSYSIEMSNDQGEKLILGYNKSEKRYFIDRTHAGQTGFNAGFAGIAYAPRLTAAPSGDLKLVVDASSVELFADQGLSVMTSLFFPRKPYQQLIMKTSKGTVVKQLVLTPMKTIW